MSPMTGTSIRDVMKIGRGDCTSMRITRGLRLEKLSYIKNWQSTVDYQSLDINTAEQTNHTRIMKVFLSLSLLVAATLAEPPVYRQQSQNERNTYYFARQEVETPAEPEAAAPYQPSGWKPDGPAFELPQKQQRQQAAPAAPQQQYGAPEPAPQQQYGAPSAPSKQYGAPAVAPQKQYGAPQAAPQQRYPAPSAPQQRYRGFSAPQRRFPAAVAPQRQFAPQSAPQQQYGAPSVPQQQYGAPPQQSYGPPDAETTTQEPTSIESEESTTLPSVIESQAEPVESVNELAEEAEVDQQQRQTGEYYVALPDGRLQRVQYMSTQDIEAMKYFARIQAENVEPLRGPIYAYSPLQKLQFAPANLRVAVPNAYAPATPVLAVRENFGAVGNPIKAAPEKLQQAQQQQQQQQQQRQPLAAEVRHDSPTAVVGLGANDAATLGSSYAPYANAKYQTPSNEQRYLVSF